LVLGGADDIFQLPDLEKPVSPLFGRYRRMSRRDRSVRKTTQITKPSASKPTSSTSYSIRARNDLFRVLLLANFGKEGRREPIIAKISQETLAEMIGTTRSRVSFFMNKFRNLGLIDYSGGIEVHSSLLNVVLREQPQIKT
jgi:CRP-like cAMP-binding protein